MDEKELASALLGYFLKTTVGSFDQCSQCFDYCRHTYFNRHDQVYQNDLCSKSVYPFTYGFFDDCNKKYIQQRLILINRTSGNFILL